MMNKVVEKYVSVWNSNDSSSLEDIFDKASKFWDTTQEGGAIEVLTGSIASTHEAFSDVSFHIISLSVADENKFFLEWQMTGVNTGVFFGHPATGKRIEIRGLDAISLKSDKIAEIKSFYDSGMFSQQLGIL
ncbi:MAG: ester cyclase [Bacteroidota bacterium]